MRPYRLAALAALAAAVASPAGALAQSYRFPASDTDYSFFYPTAYKDHGGVDWSCGDVTYAGHQGSDFGGGSWTGMAAGRHIVAAAPGLVVDAHDGEFDQCSTGDCAGGGGYGNYVVLRHPDGKTTVYGHMKSGSVAVAVGQVVACGDALGLMGSSGHSTGPHLHFEVRDIDGNKTDPFDGPCAGPPSYWVDQGAYQALPSPECGPPPPACPSATPLTCGAVLDARNDAAGSTQEHGHYGCGLEWVYSGPEVAYSFTTSLDEPVTISLTGLSGDLSIHVLASDACDGSDCLAFSDNSKLSDESVTFDALAGKTYTVVVDGFQGAVTDFHMTVACQGTWPVPPDAGAGGGTAGAGGTTGSGDTSTGGGGTTAAGGATTSAGGGGAASGGQSGGGGPSGTGGKAAPSAKSGCGCEVAGQEEGWGGLLPLALALAALRRRRATRAG